MSGQPPLTPAPERTRILSRDKSSASQPAAKSGSVASIAPGTQLNGIYQVETLLAKGGMGEVYKAHVLQTGDPVAVKVIRADLTENEDMLALFRKEASALHQLYHEAIVRYFVFSKDPILGRSYLAMEFVEGEAISEIVKAGPLHPDDVLKLAKRVALGLQAAHERGIIHRDISPDNIIIRDGDVVHAKIIDFGIARSTGPQNHTVIGAGFAGKYNYVSPEQLGLYGGDVTVQSDIYSLGLVLAEAAGGPIDMNGSMAEIIEKRRQVPNLTRFEPRLAFLLEKMLQPQPADRPDSMLAIADYVTHELGAVSKPRVTTLERPSSVIAKKKKRAPSQYSIAGIGAFVLAVASGAGLFWWNTLPAPMISPPVAELHSSEQKPSTEAVNHIEPLEKEPTAYPGLQPITPPDDPTSGSLGGAIANPDVTKDSTMTPPSNVVPTAAQSERDRIITFVNDFSTGTCSAITSLDVNGKSVTINGLGSSVEPFNKLDTAFHSVMGFEADINVRLVEDAQCPVLAFLSKFTSSSLNPPKLEISTPRLRSGQMLTGSVTNVSDEQIQVLLVGNDGAIQKFSNPVRTGDIGNFNMTILKTAGVRAGPYLVVAIASQRDISSLQSATMTARADRLFTSIEAEAKQAGNKLAVAVDYFQLE